MASSTSKVRRAGLALAELNRRRSPPDAPLMARSGAFLYGSGGLLVLATIATSVAPGSFVPGLVAVAAIALGVAAVLWIFRETVPAWIFPFLTAGGTVLITMLMFFDGSKASSYSLLYVWAALYAAYFYRPTMVLLQVAFIGFASGLDLYLEESGNVPVSRWLMVMGTSFGAALVIQELAHRVRRLADRDGLTGVANRRRLDTELERELVRAGRTRAPLCVLMLDLDNFKDFNDEMGHQQGDRHLKEAARAWVNELRDIDLLARYGGEEFAAILPACAVADGAAVADRMRALTPHGQSASAGVAQWDAKETAAALVARADAALYEAKVAGRNRTVVAAEESGDLGDPRSQPQAWAKLVPEVLEQRTVRFAYQPIVRLGDRTVIGYEALARPQGRGADISVEGLFSAAQRLGYGRDLDWLCRRLCLEASRPLISGQPLFINVGVQSILSPVHGPDQMLLLLEWSGWRASELVLEITERDQISDLEQLQEVLAAYRELGFRFAIDDVGDGHSTLEVLAAASPEYVKVARGMTAAAGRPGARAAVRAVVAFGRSLDATVIAEGIEDEHQARLMLELGCQLGQGYGLGRPQWLTAGAAAAPIRPVVLQPPGGAAARD